MMDVTHPDLGSESTLFSTLDCSKVIAPDLYAHFEGMSLIWLCLIMVGVCCCVISVVIFSLHLYNIFHYVDSYFRSTRITSIMAIFPVICILSTVSLCIPRCIPMADLFILLFNLRCLDWILLQNAIIRPILVFVAGCVWMDTVGSIDKTQLGASPFISVISGLSTMSAMWAIMIMIKLNGSHLSQFSLSSQLRFLQILLLLLNMQGNVLDLLSTTLPIINCSATLPSTVKGQMLNHLLLVLEVVILQILATVIFRPSACALFDLHPVNKQKHLKSLQKSTNISMRNSKVQPVEKMPPCKSVETGIKQLSIEALSDDIISIETGSKNSRQD